MAPAPVNVLEAPCIARVLSVEAVKVPMFVMLKFPETVQVPEPVVMSLAPPPEVIVELPLMVIFGLLPAAVK